MHGMGMTHDRSLDAHAHMLLLDNQFGMLREYLQALNKTHTRKCITVPAAPLCNYTGGMRRPDEFELVYLANWEA